MMTSLVDRQRRSFDQLVEDGVYSADFEHSPAAKDFVAAVLARAMPHPPARRRLTVLDCGCGTGAWLAFLAAALRQSGITDARLCGFDLSGNMVDVARRRLAGLAEPDDLRVGNLLDETSYQFEGATDGFDLVFAYDVVQQLPRRDQLASCELMASRLAPDGVALIFDNDSRSKFGRRMARRKFLTRYFGMKLVPRYYCNAAYPPLERFRQRLAVSGAADIHVRPDGVKRALVLAARLRGEVEPTPREGC